jgi:hypothetical protein
VFIIFLIGLTAGLAIGLRLGRRWGFNQLGTYENRERVRRAKQGGLGLF